MQEGAVYDKQCAAADGVYEPARTAHVTGDASVYACMLACEDHHRGDSEGGEGGGSEVKKVLGEMVGLIAPPNCDSI